MKLRHVFESINAWRKLSTVNMKPKIALEMLRYGKLIEDEATIIFKKRNAMVASVADENGQIALEEGSAEVKRLDRDLTDFLNQDSALTANCLTLPEVVGAVDEADETLSVQDLKCLEPFFKGYVDPATKEEDPTAGFRNEDGTPKETLDE